MRWSSKIIQYIGDKSQSRLSSRSMSKFKKFNLQKSQEEISSQKQDDKSELKLTSVQKIKYSHLNKSYISNYVNSSRIQNNNSMETKNIDSDKSNILQAHKISQTNLNKQGSQSEHNLLHNILGSQNYNRKQQLQGYSVFDNQNSHKKQPLLASFNILTCKQENSNFQNKFKQVFEKFKCLIAQLKSITERVKNQINQTTTSTFSKYQKDLQNYFDQFQLNLQSQIKKIIDLSKGNIPKQTLKENNIISNTQNYQASNNESFYRIKNFETEPILDQMEDKHMKNRPNAFKNKFKQMLNNRNQNYTEKTLIQHQNTFLQRNNTSPNRIVRKRTNPSPKVNSFGFDDSLIAKDPNQSLNSMKYRRIKDKSASKSVKKLHDKIITIKKLFNSPSNQQFSLQQLQNIQNSQKE